MLTNLLKEHTKNAHATSEKYLIGLIKEIGSKEDYANLLRLFYGFFGRLEEHISNNIDKSILPDYDSRRKSAVLLEDLQSLSEPTDHLRMCPHMPVIEDTFQALGALYVYEGSTLGGQIIARMISDRLNTENCAVSFFKSYGDRSMEMWSDFRSVLNSLKLGLGQQQRILTAANETFSALGDWLLMHDPSTGPKPSVNGS